MYHLLKQLIRPVRNILSRNDLRYDFIFGDITNVCNLRCPFCYNDWKNLKGTKPVFMTKENFKKIIDIIPLAKNGKFHFSCQFEVTLHKEFVDFLEMIPDHLKKQVMFTTNLSTKISDDVINQLSKLDINYINISIESFEPHIYEQCRKNAKHDIFIFNLERLVNVFKKSKSAPPLRYITVANKLNMYEIPQIIEKCSKKYLSSRNEIRHLWETEFNAGWVTDNRLTDTEWTALQNSLKGLPYTYQISSEAGEKFENVAKPSYKVLRFSSDGLIKFEYNDICQNTHHIQDIKHPYKFYRKILKNSI